jgi:uncharacterized membrane protein YfcA
VSPVAVLALLSGVGVVSGAVNTVAGGGSFVTLAALVWLGVPADVANATNRVGVVAQSAAAVATFRRQGVEGGGEVWGQVAVTGVGSLGGALLALAVDPETLAPILGAAMLVMVGLSLLRPRSWSEPGEPRPWRWPALLLSGAYGGFLQAGVGVLFLPALVRLGGLDPVRANARKVLLVTTLTLPALAAFAAAGQVDWAHGAALAVGSAVGGALGARLTVGYGPRLVWAVLVVVVVATAARLFLA